MSVPRPPHPPSPPHRPGRSPSWLTGRRAAGIAGALVAVAAVAAAVLVVGGGGSDTDASTRAGTSRPATTARSTTTTTRRPPTTTAAPTTTSSSTTVPPPPTTTTAPPPAPTQPQPQPRPAPGGALCIGDSVMLGASPSYMGTLTMCGTVDAAVSRQMSEGPAIVRSHVPYPSTVIIHLGTNGTVSGADVDEMMRALETVPTVVLTTVQLNGGRSWQAQANGEIRAAVARWPNARLADWEAASSGHPDYFSADGIHLTRAGAQAYAATLSSAL